MTLAIWAVKIIPSHLAVATRTGDRGHIDPSEWALGFCRRFLEVVHLVLFFFQLNLLGVGAFPAGHLRKRIFSPLLGLKFGVLGGSDPDGSRRESVHGGFRSVALLSRYIGLIQIFVLLPLPGRITASAAVTAALEASEAAAAARLGTARAPNDASDNGENDEATNHHDSDCWPLAEAGRHTVIPAG
jgi:hypothetical protein